MQLKGLPIIKVSAGGNDFILIDNREKKINMDDFLPIIPSICGRGLSVGANGVIILTGASDADFNWMCFNSDGSEASFCIDGIFPTARACRILGVEKDTVTFTTSCGTIKAEVREKKIKIFLPPPKDIRLNQELVIDDRSLNSHYVNAGVPHVLIFDENVDDVPIMEMGRKIRNHKSFLPEGANVSFIQILNNSELSIRTYERGVEGETLACGAGAFASAVISAVLGFVTPPIKVNTRSRVYFSVDTSDNSIEGVARVVYTGELQEALWQR
ncbi:diaminopimelate epimerase [candidate division WOR-3 bacterium JGI_Cruoil_03_44_89]|uniref:Diaminopimelate epimerase n=1 Tax=candidate division WOR-3 bacterium JGI_Cruoil_03_44_89 TaxID=1973748 RepID=A0A235BNC5_UNCW3|nr:MAG: diaminopimelate epimerase [candidate division WOR-3 bacterium JGI_Cruoil_03_44_89]